MALSGNLRPDALLFGESTGRVIATCDDARALLAAARDQGVAARRIGTTGGDRLRVEPASGSGEGTGPAWIDAAVERLFELWTRALPRRMEVA